MIVTITEYTQLYQLSDAEHRLVAKRGSIGYVLTDDDDNSWARDEVISWRRRHPLDCECLKPRERVYLTHGT